MINAPLLVVRGNEPIARLRVTSVEPSTSIADVLPGSVRRGMTVQPGDTVIFEGHAVSQCTRRPSLRRKRRRPPRTVPPCRILIELRMPRILGLFLATAAAVLLSACQGEQQTTRRIPIT